MQREQARGFIALALVLILGCLLGTVCAEGKPDSLGLANKTHLISPDCIHDAVLVELENDSGGVHQAESAARDASLQLRNALSAEGIEIGADSAYRSIERQREIMDEFTETYGEDSAKRTAAQPCVGEHHAGRVAERMKRLLRSDDLVQMLNHQAYEKQRKHIDYEAQLAAAMSVAHYPVPFIRV